ncbi:MAG TPA: thioredoxin domain-containing protein [Bryobacteraceae bacterium]|jgi:hypothetical protein
MNRLAKEKSPYLLQHANNPVDWYAWGDEAFEKAAREDKPVFLSIGYSTCHWCHVMERESFENEGIARLLNENFVPVKVDREERPDVDRIYMLFVQAATGSGGWPMSVWLTPDRKPFFGGTYFPPDNRYGRPGFGSVLQSLAQAWRADRAKVEDSGAQVIEQLREYAGHVSYNPDEKREAADFAFSTFRKVFDPRLGGFGGAPKFPRPSVLNFLLRYHKAHDSEDALEMVLVTLREMAKGGMNDQLGGGFHRYSVDEHWFVPHFEKMLYDQAQLAVSYLEAYQITADTQYAEVARSIFEYVLRDLAHPEGGFYSAEDADSAADAAHPHEKGEGAFYIWSHAELVAALGEKDAAAFSRRYGVEERGNVSEDPHGEFTGRNILFQAKASEDDAVIARAREVLLRLRGQRPRPHLDDKVLAGWNGMMISALAKGSQVLALEYPEDAARYGQAARRAADFVRTHLWRESDAVLLRRFRDGESAIEGFLDDYACLILGLVDLYETGFKAEDLAWAARLAERARELFEDSEAGGFFSTSEGKADLVLRLKDDYDGAEPSGNSMMTLALLRLGRLLSREEFTRSAERAIGAFAPRVNGNPTAAPQMLVAQAFAAGKPMEIVLAGPESEAMVAAIYTRFLPNAVVMRAEQAPMAMPAVAGQPTAYVCENYACKLPVTTAQALADTLQ